MPKKAASKIIASRENKENETNATPLEEHTVVELRGMLAKLNMDTKGVKSVLISRLKEKEGDKKTSKKEEKQEEDDEEIAELETKNDELTKANAKLTQENAKLAQDNAQITQDNTQLKQELADKERKHAEVVALLERKIAELEVQLRAASTVKSAPVATTATPVKAVEVSRKTPTTTNTANIFDDDFVSSLVLAHLPVSDLVNCRVVSKRWLAATNNDELWKRKYILEARLAENVKHSKVAAGHFRGMYFDRFGRDDMLSILLNNYNNTQDVKYIKQFEKVSFTTCLSYNVSYVGDTKSAVDSLIFVSNYHNEGSSFQECTDSCVDSRNINVTATMYSPTTIASIKLGAQMIHVSHADGDSGDGYNILALHDGADKPEHLCNDDREPLTDACERVIEALSLTVDPEELVADLGELFEAMTDKANGHIYSDPHVSITPTPLAEYLTSRDAIIAAKPDEGETSEESEQREASEDEEMDCEDEEGRPRRVAHKAKSGEDLNADLQEYYENLTYKSAAEARRQEAIQFAKEQGLKSSIVELLNYTKAGVFAFKIGRPQFERIGFDAYEDYKLCTVSFSEFSLELPQSEPIKLSVAVECSPMSDGDDGFNFGYSTIKINDKEVASATMDDSFAISAEELAKVTKQIKSLAVSPADFFLYMLVMSDTWKDFKARGGILKLKSLGGVKQIQNNSGRVEDFKLAKLNAQKVRDEILWDGRPDPTFRGKYVEDGIGEAIIGESCDDEEEDDDCEDEECDGDEEMEGSEGGDGEDGEASEKEDEGEEQQLPFKKIEVEEAMSVKSLLADQEIDDAAWVFYQLTKDEDVAAKKQIIVLDNDSGKYYYGDEARRVSKIGFKDTDVKTPTDDSPFTVWIQSTSFTRKLQEGTTFLYTTKKSFSLNDDEEECEEDDD